MSKKTSYVIVKEYIIRKKRKNSVTVPIILVNNVSEIMEFNTEDEATKLAQLFEANSDSGWAYKVRKIN